MIARQEELINGLKNQFELINKINEVKSTLIDIASIRRDIDESNQIRQEIEMYNKIMKDELYAEFLNKLMQVKKEISCIGILSELRDGDYPHLHIGLRRHSNGNLLDQDCSFYISNYDDQIWVDLPDGSHVYKFIGMRIHITHGEYFSSVDDLVKTEKFINRIKRFAI